MDAVKINANGVNKRRAEQLQFLRFLAFLNVFIYHSDAWNVYGYPSSNAGSFAVSFFFILSGLVTGYSGYGKELQLGWKPYIWYMWKKLCKLYPLYFITMIIPLVFSNLPELISNLEFAAAAEILKQLVKNLLLIQSWFTEGYFGINGVGWFVSTLMFLYLFSMPGVYLLNKINKHPMRLYIFTGMLGSLLFGIAVYCYLTKSFDLVFWHYIFPPARLGEYLTGMILGFLISILQGKITTGRNSELIFTVLEVTAIVLWLFFLMQFGSPWRRKIVNWLIPNLFLLGVFTFGMGYLSKIFRFKPFVRLGDISYECFLIHNIIVIRFGYYNDITMDSPLGCLVATLVCLVLTLLIAFQLNKGTSAKAR